MFYGYPIYPVYPVRQNGWAGFTEGFPNHMQPFSAYPPITPPAAYPPAFPLHVPYPMPMPFIQPPPSVQNSFLNQFKKDDGQYDINKMVDTAGQMVSTVNQISSMVKGISQIFKV
jgi:YppG-like protein